MRAVARVKEIWRYPVKSMGGESLSSCNLGLAGLVGDRLWAVTATDGSIKSARQWPALIQLAARYGSSLPQTGDCYAAAVPEVLIEFPDGRRLGSRAPDINTALAAHLDRPCRLEALRPPGDTLFYASRRQLDRAALAVELDQQDNEGDFDFSETEVPYVFRLPTGRLHAAISC